MLIIINRVVHIYKLSGETHKFLIKNIFYYLYSILHNPREHNLNSSI